jgi:ribose transport system ATP-binding protein
VVISAKNVSNKKLKNITFDLYKGEILSFYGLIGSGKTEIARVLFGLDDSTGSIEVSGSKNKISSPAAAIQSGITLVPEERRTLGLCTELSIAANIPMMNYSPILSARLVNDSKVGKLARGFIEKLRIMCRNENQSIAFLSGGNQQKVVIAKCLNSNPNILLLDEPTRGVDVGAKQEIFAIIRELARQGNSVVVFSSELHEVLNLCDRIGLLYDGELKEIMENNDSVDQERIMQIVTGGC